jgi:hypothetical protein
MANHDIVPVHLAVKAMRDSGYKNAAYAIAELIDNSIQAGATKVELLCAEKVEFLKQRQRSRIQEIAVLDNGSGMDASILRMALQFGNGTRLNDRSGIGRFGMGLPNSSISQAQRVDVWTWQNGLDSAIHAYLDIGEIETGYLSEVPEPQPSAIPTMWHRVGGDALSSQSGTLVVWSKLDRIMWRTARAIIDNSEMLVGRMYRYFLHDGSVSVRMAWFDMDAAKQPPEERYAVPNDPMYLIAPTSCPAPFDDQPMFELFGQPNVLNIKMYGEVHPVTITFSVAKQSARDGRNGQNPGSLPHGKHAANNLGLSLVRARRELELDPGWAIAYDPIERWWGVEVQFPPALDDLFGVTNNKQSARNFASLAKQDIEELIKDNRTYSSAMRELEADQDPNAPLLEIAQHISKNISSMRALLKAQTKGIRSERKRHDELHAVEKGTLVTRKRTEEGYIGESDNQEKSLTPDEREEQIKDLLTDEGVMDFEAREIAAQTVSRGLKYTFASLSLDSPSFFDVKSRGGAIHVSLNMAHPAYPKLIEVLDDEVSNVERDDLEDRLVKAREGLRLLLMAWARYEDEQPDGARRSKAQDARWDWGRVAREFLEEQ